MLYLLCLLLGQVGAEPDNPWAELDNPWADPATAVPEEEDRKPPKKPTEELVPVSIPIPGPEPIIETETKKPVIDEKPKLENLERLYRQREIKRKIQFTRERMAEKFIPTPHGEFQIIKDDLLRNVDPSLRPFTRYMTAAFYPGGSQEVEFVDFTTDPTGKITGLIPDVNNPFIARTDKMEISRWELANRIAMFGLNSLSQHSSIKFPEFVQGTNGRIIRFYTVDFKIRSETWEWFVAQDEYFKHIVDSDVAKICGSLRPLVRTDWFLAKAFTEPNYTALLYSSRLKGLPKTETDIHNFYAFNLKDVEGLDRDFWAAVNGENSFVALYSRRLKRYDGILDYLHVTDDFKKNLDTVEKTKDGKKTQYVIKDPIENLLDPSKSEFFLQPQHKNRSDVIYKPDAHEGIFQLPNKLQGYYLSDGVGNLVAFGDPEVVRDTRNPYEPVVRNGKSCIWCHQRGMNIPTNTAEQHLGKILDVKTYDPRVLDILRRLYTTEHGSKVYQDSQAFCLAVGMTNHLDASTNGEAFRQIVQWYDYQPLDAEQIAVEHGITLEQLQAAAQRSTSVRLMGLFGNPPTPIPRHVWEKLYQNVTLLLGPPG